MASAINCKITKFIAYGAISAFFYSLFWAISLIKEGRLNIILADSDSYLYFAAVFILLILLGLYIKSYNIVSEENIPIKYIIIFAVLFNALLVFMPPITSTDLYSYISRSRVVSEYNENPYIVPYDSFSNDKLYSSLKTVWSGNTAIYGPLFISTGAAFAYLAGDNLYLNIFIFKLAFAAINILIIFIIQKITNNKKAVFLYAWNPFIVFEFALNSHNDVILILFVALSLFCFFKKSSVKTLLAGWSFLVFSALIKFFTLIFLPFYLIFAIRNLERKKEKIIFTVLACLSGVFFAALAYYPYWEGVEIFSRLSALVEKKSVFSSLGIGVVIIFLLIFKIPNYYWWSKTINRGIFIVAYFLMLFRLIFIKKEHKKNNLLKYFIFSFGLFIATFFTWLMPWYMTLLIALIAIDAGMKEKRKNAIYIYCITAYGIIFYFILR